MLIKNMRKVKNPDSKTKALFSVETKNFIINDCRLELAGSGKLIARLPFSVEIFQGRTYYRPIIEFKDLDYVEAISEAAVKAYEAINKGSSFIVLQTPPQPSARKERL